MILKNDESNIVQPDIMIVCNMDKLDGKCCNGAPDFIIEITSPNDPGRDYITKLSLYKLSGVKEYWIVNPQEKSITLYYFDSNLMAQHYTFKDKIKVNIYDDLVIDFNELNI